MLIQFHAVYEEPHPHPQPHPDEGMSAHVYPVLVFFKNCPRLPAFSGSNLAVFVTTWLVMSIPSPSVYDGELMTLLWLMFIFSPAVSLSCFQFQYVFSCGVTNRCTLHGTMSSESSTVLLK